MCTDNNLKDQLLHVLYRVFALTLTWKLLQVSNAVDRLVSNVNKFHHISPVLAHLHWLPVFYQARFKVLVFSYKALSGLLSHFLSEHLSLKISSHTA